MSMRFGMCEYARPSCIPNSRVKFRDDSTIRASIITCGVGRSSFSIKDSTSSMRFWVSVMIVVLVRASIKIVPRLLKSFVRLGCRSFAVA